MQDEDTLYDYKRSRNLWMQHHQAIAEIALYVFRRGLSSSRAVCAFLKMLVGLYCSHTASRTTSAFPTQRAWLDLWVRLVLQHCWSTCSHQKKKGWMPLPASSVKTLIYSSTVSSTSRTGPQTSLRPKTSTLPISSL